MECAPKYKFGLFGSLFFFAVVFSSLLFPPLADKKGRKPVGMTGLLIHLTFGVLMIITKSVKATQAFIFFMGVAMPARVFVGYIYAMEFIP